MRNKLRTTFNPLKSRPTPATDDHALTRDLTGNSRKDVWILNSRIGSREPVHA
jgi:hypothetical protein